MNARRLLSIAATAALSLFTACASSPPRTDPYATGPGAGNTASQHGNVSRIEFVPSEAGGAGGAVIGAEIGSQIGDDTGRFDYQSIDDLRVDDRVRIERGLLHRI